MARLYTVVARTLCIRFVRSIGYTGSQPVAVGGVGVALVLGLDIALALFLRGRVASVAAAVGPAWHATMVAALVELTFLSAGPILVLAESISLQASRVRPMLLALPVTEREAGLAIRIPTVAVVAVMLLLVLVVAASAISELVPDLLRSAGVATAGLLSGAGLAAIPTLMVRVVMRGARWIRVRLPCTLVSLMAPNLAEVWALRDLFLTSHLSSAGRFLICPWIVAEIRNRGYLDLPLAVTCDLVGLRAFALLLVAVVEVGGSEYGRELWTWSRRWPVPVMTLELTRLLRSGDVMANAVGAAVLIFLLGLVQTSLSLQLRSSLSSVVLSAVGMLAAMPTLMVRSQSRLRRPAQLLLGLDVRLWTWSLIGAGALIGACLVVLGDLTLLVVEGPSAATVEKGVPYAFMAFGLAAAIGWAMPAGPDNPIGQMVNVAILLVAGMAVYVWAPRLLGFGGLEWSGGLLAIGCCGVAVAFLIEDWRQRRALPSRGRQSIGAGG